MEDNHMDAPRPANPRRRKKTKMQIFKEAYLPVVIAGVAIILILVFIIGAIIRASQSNDAQQQVQQQAEQQADQELAQLQAEEAHLMAEAAILAESYDYEGAINVLNQFRGDLSDFPKIANLLEEYIDTKNQLIPWDDPNQVVNLSFQLLIADPSRTFTNESYGTTFNRNFLTTAEFSSILQQLYDNDYILVNTSDLYEVTDDLAGNTVCVAKTLYLPEGKKPLVLTQTNVNYNYYLIDSDQDKLPDEKGGGFGTKLILQDDSLMCELITASGQTVTGAYDLIPILESFVELHPDFSYKGAKATIALTGYNGLFGYRTEPSAKDRIGADAYDQAITSAARIGSWLQSNGYELACYTYENIAYGSVSLEDVQEDMSRWQTEVVPILGEMDTIVFAQNSDLTDSLSYSGEKYELLKDMGFRYYVGFCNEGSAWANVAADYVRQGRVLVNAVTITQHPEWFAGLFNTSGLLDSSRPTITE